MVVLAGGLAASGKCRPARVIVASRAGHDGAGDWDKEDAYEAKLRKERGEPEVLCLGRTHLNA